MFNSKILGDMNPIIWYSYKTYKSKCPPPGKRFVRSYELELIYWSEGGCEIINNKRYNLQVGDLVFRKPGMVVESIPKVAIYRIMFSLAYPKSGLIMDPINRSKVGQIYMDDVYKNNQELEIAKGKAKFPIDFPYILKTSQYNEFKTLFESIFIERNIDREQTHLFIKTYLLQIFVLMYYELTVADMISHPSHPMRTNYAKILSVKKYIENNIKRKFSIEELATHAGLCPSYFSKIFKNVVGQSPIDYINKIKIDEIKNVLISTDVEIKEVYREYGFEDSSYFFRVFKKYLATTPSTFRKLYQTQSLMDCLILPE